MYNGYETVHTLGHIHKIPNSINAPLVKNFYEYLKEIGTSENYQNQNLKQLIGFAKSLGTEKTFYDIKNKDEIVLFLNTKIKDNDVDPDKKWITTWNDYLWRIKYFFRWLQTEPEYMCCPNPTQPDLNFTIISNILIYY